MTPRERTFWLRVQRRAQSLTPGMTRAFLRGLSALADELTEAELVALIETASVDRVLARAYSEQAMERAFAELREEIRGATIDSSRWFLRDIPKATAIVFDTLSPRVLDAVRALDTRVIRTLGENIRATVRQHIERGLVEGVNPRTMARGLRSVIGLAPNQEAAVANFRRMLLDGDREALTRALRDRRYDRTLERALGRSGDGLSADQVEKMTAAYRKRFIAFNAETNARTASLDSLKQAQRLSWQESIAQGVVDPDRLRKTWVTVGDNRVRPEHVEMNGETVGFDDVFSNGEVVPGESTFNCRCLARVFQAARASAV